VRIRLFLVIVLASLGAGFVAPLAAHTEVFQRSPESGVAYGGTIDEVQISFFATIASSEIRIVGPDGEPLNVEPTTLARGERIAVAEFPALTEPGAYLVVHTELAGDGDSQTDSFQFFFDPTSENETTSLIVGDDGPNWVLLGIIAGVVLILAGLFWPGRK
jgi:methionine-rich copper-binding protein CopC